MTDDDQTCPHCGHLTPPIRVAGHTQCAFCTKVLDECCSGETVGIAEEGQVDSDA